MNTKKEIRETHKLVKEILEQDPKTRNSDDILYLAIVKKLCPATISVSGLFTNRAFYNVPPYETVRRTRQRLQAELPELRGNDKRRQRAKDFRAYALSEWHESEEYKAALGD